MEIDPKAIILVLIMYLILIISLNFIHNPIPSENINYVLHAVEFFILTFLLLHLFTKHHLFYAVLLALFINILLEYAQLYIVYRKFQPFDILAGFLGSMLVVGLRGLKWIIS